MHYQYQCPRSPEKFQTKVKYLNFHLRLMVAIGLIYLFSALWTLIDVFKAPILFSNHIFGLETRPAIVKSF